MFHPFDYNSALTKSFIKTVISLYIFIFPRDEKLLTEHQCSDEMVERPNIPTEDQADVDRAGTRSPPRLRIQKSRRVRKQASAIASNRHSGETHQLQALPPLLSEKSDAREQALIRKLRQCHFQCDFNDPTADLKNKEIKRAALNDLLDFFTQISWSKSVVNEKVFEEIISMVSANILRDLPPCDLPDFDGAEEDEPIMDASWTHLQLVYDLFLRFLESSDFDIRLAKRHISQNFVFRVIKLFDSLDSREREMLKTVLHRLYGKLLGMRAYIRKEIGHVFLIYAYEDPSFHGIAELLEIIGSIINGFALPVKQEHVQFLNKVLMPLHRPYNMSIYHENLLVCVLQYLEKNPVEFAPPIIHSLLKFWPKTNSQKTLAFITELEEILARCSLASGQGLPDDTIIAVTRQLALCVCSQSFQVSERALAVWNGQVFMRILKSNIGLVMPIMFPALYQASKEHWNSTVVQLVYQLLTSLMEWEPKLFEELVDEYKQQQEARMAREAEISHKWKLIEAKAGGSLSILA